MVRVRVVLVSLMLAACGPKAGPEGEDSGGEGTGTSSTTVGSTTSTGDGDSGDGDGEDETGACDETGADPCEYDCSPMDASFGECGSPTDRAYVWNGEDCVLMEGCGCSGESCDDIYPFEPELNDPNGRGALFDCWRDYIDAECMAPPCECQGDTVCSATFDGTCAGGIPSCVPAPSDPACMIDPDSCECGDMVCGEFASSCEAPPCPNEWGGIPCYGP